MKATHWIATASLLLGIGIGMTIRGGAATAAPEIVRAQPLSPHFQVSSWADNGHGCYVIDTNTGAVWKINDNKITKISESVLLVK